MSNLWCSTYEKTVECATVYPSSRKSTKDLERGREKMILLLWMAFMLFTIIVLVIGLLLIGLDVQAKRK